VNSVKNEGPQLLGGCKIEQQLLFKFQRQSLGVLLEIRKRLIRDSQSQTHLELCAVVIHLVQ